MAKHRYETPNQKRDRLVNERCAREKEEMKESDRRAQSYKYRTGEDADGPWCR